jgi:hypothetical protein
MTITNTFLVLEKRKLFPKFTTQALFLIPVYVGSHENKTLNPLYRGESTDSSVVSQKNRFSEFSGSEYVLVPK